jgi:hypothetical protein
MEDVLTTFEINPPSPPGMGRSDYLEIAFIVQDVPGPILPLRNKLSDFSRNFARDQYPAAGSYNQRLINVVRGTPSRAAAPFRPLHREVVAAHLAHRSRHDRCPRHIRSPLSSVRRSLISSGSRSNCELLTAPVTIAIFPSSFPTVSPQMSLTRSQYANSSGIMQRLSSKSVQSDFSAYCAMLFPFFPTQMRR